MNMPVIGCDLEDIEFLATGWHCYKLGYQYYKNKLLEESSNDLALMESKSPEKNTNVPLGSNARRANGSLCARKCAIVLPEHTSYTITCHE